MTAAAKPAVHAAWAAVMADVRELAKGDRNDQHRFMFRGIDATMNAVGPALRKHGVAVVPTNVETTYRDVQTSNGKPQREATVRVTYTIVGPNGDTLDGMAPGESADSGDKATPKAMSVALRTFLLQALCLPTQDTDPDQHVMERASEPTPMESLLSELTSSSSEEQVRQVGNRAHARGVLDLVPAGGRQTFREMCDARIAQMSRSADAPGGASAERGQPEGETR